MLPGYGTPPPAYQYGGPLGLMLYLRSTGMNVGSMMLAQMAASQMQAGASTVAGLTQQQYGQWLSSMGYGTPSTPAQAGGGESAGGGDGSPGGGRDACVLRDPETTPISAEVSERIERFERRMRADIAPLGTHVPAAPWNEVQGLSFRTPKGIRLARQLLWYVKAKIKGRTGKEGTKVRYNGRVVDLLDPQLEPSSFDEINDKTPLFGEHIAAREANDPQIVVGSPFTSVETWDAIRTILGSLRGHGLACRPAEGLDGDAWAAFELFARDVRGYTHVEIDGRPVDFMEAYIGARGGGADDYTKPARPSTLKRGYFWTIEDRRITVEDRKATRPVMPGDVPFADAASAGPEESGSAGARVRGPGAGAAGTARIEPRSTTLDELFGRLFEESAGRFDMPVRREDGYDQLWTWYAERFVRTVVGPLDRRGGRAAEPPDLRASRGEVVVAWPLGIPRLGAFPSSAVVDEECDGSESCCPTCRGESGTELDEEEVYLKRLESIVGQLRESRG